MQISNCRNKGGRYIYNISTLTPGSFHTSKPIFSLFPSSGYFPFLFFLFLLVLQLLLITLSRNTDLMTTYIPNIPQSAFLTWKFLLQGNVQLGILRYLSNELPAPKSLNLFFFKKIFHSLVTLYSN